MIDKFYIIHKKPKGISDKIAYRIVKILRFFADSFFAKRYGNRAVVLETIAAVPGMVGGLLQHLKAIRYVRDDKGWIRELVDEAENERMHLMTFIKIAKPSIFERFLIMVAQAIFFNFYFFLYLFFPKTAHRMIGYFEEEAIISYTEYLKEINEERQENIPAPEIAINYWNLKKDAKLKDVVLAIRDDECKHRDVNHEFAEKLKRKQK
jgi:ubiquinol oxidase